MAQDSTNNEDSKVPKRSAFFKTMDKRRTGNNANTLPTVRQLLQANTESATAAFDIEPAKNFRDEWAMSVARLKYGALNIDDPRIAAAEKNYKGSAVKGFAKSVIGGGGNAGGILTEDETEAIFDVATLQADTKFDYDDFKKDQKEVKKSIQSFFNGNASLSKTLEKMKEYATNNALTVAAGSTVAGYGKAISDKLKGVGESLEAAFFSDGGFSLKTPLIGAKDMLVDGIGAIKRLGLKMIGNMVFGPNNIIGNATATPVANLRSNVMLLPPSFTNIVDPGGRCYLNNVGTTQHICSILPGHVNWDGLKLAKDFGITDAALGAELDAFENGDENSIIMDNTSAFMSFLAIMQNKKQRLASFDPDIGRFIRVYSVIVGRMRARLSKTPAVAMFFPEYSDRDAFSTGLATTGWGGFQLALGSNTTLMESNSNNWAGSPLEGLAGSASQKARSWQDIKNQIMGSNSDGKSGAKTLVGALLQGDQINFPRHWENSSFSKSYTLNFRLESPYGDPEHLFEYVYKPFACLLAMSLPIYRSQFGFSSPFAIRVDCPGWFTVDTGYVTSIDIRRAPDENSWTAHGMASAIEVNMSIMDTYEAMGLSTGPASLSRNHNMQAYLDNICGMDYKEIYSGGSISSQLRTYMSYWRTMPDSGFAAVRAGANKKLWAVPYDVR